MITSPSVGDLTDTLPVSRPAVSQQLKVLMVADLVFALPITKLLFASPYPDRGADYRADPRHPQSGRGAFSIDALNQRFS